MKEVDISGITALTKDRDTSIRLYRSYQKRHFDKSASWVVQKVISDLERDRGFSGKKIEVRTRKSHRKKQSSEFYWFWGVLIAKGTWFDRNRVLVAVSHWFLMALIPYFVHSTG